MARDELTERVAAVERKVDGVAESLVSLRDSVDQRFDAVQKRFDAMDQRFETVDRRFEAVDRRFDEMGRAADSAFIEQREYTEFVFTQLEAKMDAGLTRVDGHIARLERKIDHVIDLLMAPRP